MLDIKHSFIFLLSFFASITSNSVEVIYLGEGEKSYSAQQFPFFVKNLLACGGAILSEFWIVSAAHCTIDQEFKLAFGALNENDYDVAIRTSFAVKNLKEDIALLRLSKPLIYSDTIKNISLPPKWMTEEYLDGKNVVICGFDDSNELHYDSAPFVLCPVYDGRKICTHAIFTPTDSGGPIFYNENGINYLIGVVTMKYWNGYDGNTSIFHNMNWILNVTGLKRPD